MLNPDIAVDIENSCTHLLQKLMVSNNHFARRHLWEIVRVPLMHVVTIGYHIFWYFDLVKVLNMLFPGPWPWLGSTPKQQDDPWDAWYQACCFKKPNCKTRIPLRIWRGGAGSKHGHGYLKYTQSHWNMKLLKKTIWTRNDSSMRKKDLNWPKLENGDGLQVRIQYLGIAPAQKKEKVKFYSKRC